MRIAGGIAKGRKLPAPKGDYRPTSAKVREALFDILRPRIMGAHFVDLYAGSGAIGIEALSEGAEDVTFVESDPSRADAIRQNLKLIPFSGGHRVVKRNTHAFLKEAEKDGESFDIVFLDPPYHTDELDRTIKSLAEIDILKSGGIIVAEHSVKKAMPETIGSARFLRSYRYGDTVLSLYGKD